MKKPERHDRKKRKSPLAPAACLFSVIACFAVSAVGADGDARMLQLMMKCALGVLAAVTAWLLIRRPADQRYRILLAAVVCAGILMRIGYMLYTPAELRQHDLGPLTPDGVGHAGYIKTLLGGHLPSSSDGQFYHPPLFHLLAAAAVSCYQALSGETDFAAAMEAAQAVSCCASILTLFYARKLCAQVRLSESGTLLAVALAAFLPNHYLLAGRINNDALVIFFFTAAIFYTVRWYHGERWRDLCRLALCYGLGMMTKTSLAAAALVTGCLMLAVLLRQFRQHSCGRTLRQYAAFAAISLPLGLWYPLRNRLAFGQPLNYVFQIPSDSDLYCGNYSFWQRFGIGGDLFSLYDHPYDDYNVWQYLWRGSLFGEFSFEAGKALPLALLLLNLFLIVCSFFALIFVLTRRRRADWILLAAFWMVQIGAYLLFNLQYPFGCTMDFRYVVPTALLGALFLAEMLDLRAGMRGDAMLGKAVNAAAAVFSVLSMVMFCNI